MKTQMVLQERGKKNCHVLKKLSGGLEAFPGAWTSCVVAFFYLFISETEFFLTVNFSGYGF
jgi:hypothetical protein